MAAGFTITRVLSCATGTLMYAYYFDCDPIAQKVVSHSDKMVPHFVMDVARDLPGLSGIFIAGVFSASLSTVSSILNTLAGTVYKDFIEGWLPKKPSEQQAAIYLKGITLIQGIAIFFLVMVVEKLGSILEVALSLTGMTTGATFGLFLLGMFVPWAESVGALTGASASLGFMSVVTLGNLQAKHSGRLRYPMLPTRTDGCNATLTNTTAPSTPLPVLPTLASRVEYDEDLFPLFRISPFLFVVIGVAITVTVGSAVSALVRAVRTRRGQKGGFADLPDPEMFSPPVGRAVRRRLAGAGRGKREEAVEMYQAVPLKADDVHSQAG
ncbi:hypothetical protein FOCC_FOCC012105 [Frankliniella occidentalis]|nr:hypothetical protein FOCC_FOCC012105 [Frankliniella occidentalis]